MAGLRSINVNSLSELYWDRGEKAPSARLIDRAKLSARRGRPGATAALELEGVAPAEELTKLRGSSNEAASRQHLEVILEDLGSEKMHALTAPDRPQVVPDLVVRSESVSTDLGSNAVSYQQAPAGIPVFGARVVVDVDTDDNSLVALNGKLSPPPDASGLATLSPADAWAKLVAQTKGTAETPPNPPALNWYVNDDETFALTYRFREVPRAPQDDSDPAVPRKFKANPCVRHSARYDSRAYDYFVDAQDGSIRYFFSSAHHFIPQPMRGEDCFGQSRDFYGELSGSRYVLRDPLRKIETYDYGFQDIDAVPMPAVPGMPLTFQKHDIESASPAAVSAHWHATLVFDFFNDILKRDGVDDKGMKLVSVVNVYASGDQMPHPQWPNASWWQNIMWYGQEDDGNGGLVSFSKHLDIIAHELAHGVTSTSSNLVYRDLSGALNESFSDIFGIFVANWYPSQPNPIAGWNWQIGPGLGENGGPLRDFANPAAAGQPDHMNQYEKLPASYDNGGVHIYSGIHNKAVHGVLTAADANGDPVIPTREAALLLYLTLIRLTPTSDFSDARRTLLTVAGVYYQNHPDRDARLQAIKDAYDAVGIA